MKWKNPLPFQAANVLSPGCSKLPYNSGLTYETLNNKCHGVIEGGSVHLAQPEIEYSFLPSNYSS